MRTIDAAERRARLGRRHHLAEPGPDVATVAGDLCGIHSTDPASVVLALRRRVADFAVADAERALYDERDAARILAMRRTMFVVPTHDVALFHAASTRAQVTTQARRNERYVVEGGVVPAGRTATGWLAEVGDATVAALRSRGAATAREVAEDMPALRTRIPVGVGTPRETTIGLSTRVLFLLATEGRIVRGRPRGTWRSTQYAWAPVDTWFDGRVDVDALDDAEARAGLAARWLATFGPGSLVDLQWWSGWTRTRTRAALAAVGAVEVDLGDGRTGWVASDDVDPVAPPAPWVALLPSLDSTTMGWKEREHLLDPAHLPRLFDRMGNVGPTVVVDGRVVGGWAHRDDGEVVVELLTDVGADATEAIDAEAAAVSAWLGEVRFVPRFRTPLERDLTNA